MEGAMSLGLAALLGGTTWAVVDTVWASGAVVLGNSTVQDWAKAFLITHLAQPLVVWYKP